jgi:hypothetical protein
MSAGTDPHIFGEGSSEVLVADRLQERFPKVVINVDYHGLLDIDSFIVDTAHHGPNTGGRNWLQGNVARLYLKSMMMDDLDAGEIPANLVLRGHYHSFVQEWCSITRMDKLYKSWIVVMPPLCLPSAYTHKATKSIYRITSGVVAFEIINGRLYETYPFVSHLDIRTKRVL